MEGHLLDRGDDRLPELRIVQESVVFPLLLLHRHGGPWRPASYYEQRFLSALPTAQDECPDTQFFTPEDFVVRAFTLRVLDRLAAFCGLVDMKPRGIVCLIGRALRVWKTVQLDQCAHFSI